MMKESYVLALVDISKMQSAALSDRLEFAAALDQSCKDIGFLYLKGDQFNFDFAETLIQVTKRYFQQDDRKNHCVLVSVPQLHHRPAFKTAHRYSNK